MVNIFEDKKESDDIVRCVLRVGTLSELWVVTSMAVDGDYDASKVMAIDHVDTGERDAGKRPGYDRIYDAHFTAKAGDVVVMYPNALLGREGSRFFEVATDGMRELANLEEVLRVMAAVGRVEPIEEYA